MFELRKSGENQRKRSEIFFENLPREYKDLILVKKNSKLSHACVPLKAQNGALEGRGRSQWRLETQTGVLEGLRPVVTDSHHSDEEQDTD
jgi:hypothetical protein